VTGHAGSYLALVGVWCAMLAVMMLPLTWPWLLALHRLSTELAGVRPLDRRVAPAFGLGYLVVWTVFAFVAAGLQVLLAGAWSGGSGPLASALIGAGLYQLTPLKSSCLERCRSPLSALLARWPIGFGGALRLGAEHGLFCLGCCWALMLLALGTGRGGWTWMALLTALVAAEKLTRPGARLARWAGAALLALGLFSLLRT
jgi:predicted metal-binding membrane protein